MKIDLKKLCSAYSREERIRVPLKHKLIGWYTSSSYGWSLLKRKPLAFWRLLWYIFLNRFFGAKKEIFRSISLAITYDCNLNCAHCNVAPMKNDHKKLLTHSDYLKFNTDLKRIGFLSYIFTGGEPLLRKDLVKLIGLLGPKDKLIMIQTNGIFLTPSVIRRLSRAGVDVLNISIDSMHSLSTEGKSRINYKRCDKILEWAEKNHLKVQFSCVITPQSLINGEFEEVINYCFSRRVLTIGNLPIPLGNWGRHRQIILPKKYARFARALEKQTPYFRTDHLNNLRGKGCPAFKEKLYLTPYGDILGCTFLPFSIGNIRTESLASILKRREQLPFFSKYKPFCPPAESQTIITSLHKAVSKRKTYPADLKTIKRYLPNA